jgi:hypothetical protein
MSTTAISELDPTFPRLEPAACLADVFDCTLGICKREYKFARG